MNDYGRAVENTDLHVNNNNKNMKRNFKTENALGIHAHTHTHLTARCVGLLKVKNSCRIVIRSPQPRHWGGAVPPLLRCLCHQSKTPQTYNVERSCHFDVYRCWTFSRYSPGGGVGSCVHNKNHFFCDKTYDRSTSRPYQVRVKLILVFYACNFCSSFSLVLFFKFLLFVLSRTPSVPTDVVGLMTKTITPAIRRISISLIFVARIRQFYK